MKPLGALYYNAPSVMSRKAGDRVLGAVVREHVVARSTAPESTYRVLLHKKNVHLCAYTAGTEGIFIVGEQSFEVDPDHDSVVCC